ncbi:MAG: signal peptidase II [Myxococcales bacterium]|nr:signal peptidase II [Myxococcales bacterium]MDD9970637.1 signal peptidase II [Myxococcales bacterium]
MTQRRSPKAITLCLLFLAFFTWLDLWTKDWATRALPCDPETTPSCRIVPNKPPSRNGGIELVPGYLDFSYAENRGAAFGMLNDAPGWVRATLFTGAATVATAALLWMFVTFHGGPLFAWSVPLIVSGALGNMVDRWRLGYVVDFIRFHLHDGWEWPTFNVADITITIGVAFLLLDGMRRPRTADEAPAAPGSAPEATS